MKSEVEDRYIPICSRVIDGRAATAWLSAELTDSAWDDFLQGTALGHFQQSGLWARSKSGQGWRPIRIVLKLDGQIAGGFQILARRTPLGGIGYLYKGPVVVPEEPVLLDFLIELVVLTAKTNHLQAVIIQPPDESTMDGSRLARHRFLPNYLINVHSATLVVDVTSGSDEIRRRMRKSAQVELRQSERRGIKVREGGEQDISKFFSLMVATCERQGMKPVPATESALLEVWKAFYPSGCVRLSFAEYDGEAVAGAFCLCFGERMTIWKKGWSGQHRERHPNQPMIFEAMEWAHHQGYKYFDFVALDREIAMTLLRGESLLESQKKGRDMVHLGYGGMPRLLVESRIYITNPLGRLVYRVVGSSPRFQAFVKRVAMKLWLKIRPKLDTCAA